jgi:hypothetical protein
VPESRPKCDAVVNAALQVLTRPGEEDEVSTTASSCRTSQTSTESSECGKERDELLGRSRIELIRQVLITPKERQ